MAALFPTENWFKWMPANMESATKNKASSIEAYMRTKLRDSQFSEFVSQMILDYIDYGNCFATVEYVNEGYLDQDGRPITSYIGPRAVRISPLISYLI